MAIDPNEKRTGTMSIRAWTFLSNCLSRRGGQHPGDEERWRAAYQEAQDAVLDVFAAQPVETCPSARSELVACTTPGVPQETPPTESRDDD